MDVSPRSRWNSCIDRHHFALQAETTDTPTFHLHSIRVPKRPTMDATPQNTEVERLIQRAAASRAALSEHLLALRHRANIPTRLKENILSHRSLWFGGSALAGLAATSLLRSTLGIFRKKSPTPPTNTTPAAHRRKGLASMALTLAFTLAKPAIKSFLITAIKKRLIPTQNPPYKSRHTL